MRITALRCHSWGPAGYRVDMPMAVLRKLGHEVRVLDVTSGGWTPAWFAGWDVVILQRQADPQWADLIGCIPADQRPALVYETDDLLWRITPDGSDAWKGTLQRGIRETMRRCDAVTVSTPELAEEARKLNPRVHCVLNAIDFGRRDWETRDPRRPAGHSVVIGWAGTLRGQADFLTMGPALRDTLKAHPEACFAIGGDEEQSAEFCHRLNLPEEQVYVLPPATFESYPQMVGAFDIGIAPLADTLYNRCKSELKVMEYSALGIPWVASDVAPYQRFRYAMRLRGAGGCLATTPFHWRQQLEALVSSEELRHACSAPNQAFVRGSYSLEARGRQWEAILREVAPRDTPREVAIR